MLQVEEDAKLLSQLKEKLQELGESLWHTETRKRTKRTWRANDKARVLEWYQKFYQSTSKDKKLKKQVHRI